MPNSKTPRLDAAVTMAASMSGAGQAAKDKAEVYAQLALAEALHDIADALRGGIFGPSRPPFPMWPWRDKTGDPNG